MRRLILFAVVCGAVRGAVPIPDVPPKKPVTPQINALAWRPDGKMIALGTFEEVRLVDPSTKAVVATLKGHTEQVRAVAFSSDGKMLAAAGGLPARGGEVKIWDLDARKELLTIKGHSDCIYSVAFSPDGKTLATGGYDKMILIWDTSTGKQI